MGVKGDTDWFTAACLVKTTLAKLRLEIIRYFNLDEDDRPVLAVDASVWVRKILNHPRDDSIVLSQYHANPRIPVTAVADYFQKRINLIRSMKFEPILVFDGQINPLKSQEHDIRQGNTDRQSLIQQLTNMFNNPESHDVKEVAGIQKKLMVPRKDVLYEVIHNARKNNVKVVGAPYETDTQIVALLRQGVIHGAISTDSDYTAMGVPFVISDLVLKGGTVEVRSYEQLTKVVLPSVLDVTDPVVGDDLNFLVHMLGTDNLPKGLKGSGKVDVIKRMKEYLSKPSKEQKEQYISEYINNHDTPTQCLHAMNYWQHGPAYKIKPTNPDESPKAAFFSSNEYEVILCSMSLDESHQYEPINTMMGFEPSDKLRDGHTPQQHQPTHYEFFCCMSWSRDGLPFEPLPTQYNSSGYAVLHCAIINFEDIPLKFVPTRNLKMWLACRGVPVPSLDSRKQIEDMVTLCHRYCVEPLPDFVMRIGGRSITYSVMNFDNEDDAVWYTGDDALREIRSAKLPLLEEESVLESFFHDQHTSKRNRCLSHLFDGSYDLNDLKVTSNLKSQILGDDVDLFVIEFLCAPSQKGLGTEEKVYNVRLVFRVENGAHTLLPFPHSICSCAVGICKCAHKLGMLLVIHAIRGRFCQLNFEEVITRMPPNIHAVARQCHLVTHLYPPLDSTAYGDEREIAAMATEVIGEVDGEVDGELDDEVDCEIDEEFLLDEEEDNDNNEVTITSTSGDGPVAEDDTTNDDGLALENRNDWQNAVSEEELGFKKVKPINLKRAVGEWCVQAEARLCLTGAAHKLNIDESQSACQAAATMQHDPDYLRSRDIRMKRIKRSVDNNDMPKSMISWYADDYVTRECGGNNDDIDSQFMKYPNPYP